MTKQEIILYAMLGLFGIAASYLLYQGIKLVDNLTGLHLLKAWLNLKVNYHKLTSYQYNQAYNINGHAVREIRTLKDKDSKRYQDMLNKMPVYPGHLVFRLDTRAGELHSLDVHRAPQDSGRHTIESLSDYGFIRILPHSYYFTALNHKNADEKLRKKLNQTTDQWKEKQPKKID